ncbi:DNA-binding protein [Halomicroarcula sp. GCM10025709]|uniref:DNA-binding protein n=1 Tax=Haloarcula TaxID=2237 RepID=UPI0024C21B4A|nr:DNA-binding protein [Halomicroarcula sp. YJ-61-S]
MSIENSIRYEVSHDEQTVADEAVTEEVPELQRSVAQEIQAKVDTNHFEVAGRGLTLEAEERMAAREAEIGRTRSRWDHRQDSDREARTRDVAERRNEARRRRFSKRAASVDPWAEPDRVDPRTGMTRKELASVNKQARRIQERVQTGTTTAALSKRLARRMAEGADIVDASVSVTEAEWLAPGTVVPIEIIGNANRSEVDIAGRVTVLWESSSPAISQVGLIEDGTSITKFTVWRASDQPVVKEGERVRFRAVAKSWYEGRVSVALTGWSRVEFPEREERL